MNLSEMSDEKLLSYIGDMIFRDMKSPKSYSCRDEIRFRLAAGQRAIEAMEKIKGCYKTDKPVVEIYHDITHIIQQYKEGLKK